MPGEKEIGITSTIDEWHLRYAGPGACFTPAWPAPKLCVGESNRLQCSSLGRQSNSWQARCPGTTANIFYDWHGFLPLFGPIP